MSDSSGQILIFVVAYNAAEHIKTTLDQISRKWLGDIDYEILIIDDASEDNTARVSRSYASANTSLNIKVKRNDSNLGYGGNQKLGYNYAIENKFDVVVMLHGDGQYAPSHLPMMITPIIEGEVEVVFGSRMLNKSNALKGNMPLYKWIGNQVLTTIQNVILGTSLAEFHTGYRAYSKFALESISFNENSDYFDFDTEIIIQLIDRGYFIYEIPIPTFYGDEVSYVNGFKYAFLIIRATIWSRFVKWGWFNDKRFSIIE